jgi:pyruvate/2-oxoglutarate dehydrogenase complex dihydrolipoamide acyltransferase (E2) component
MADPVTTLRRAVLMPSVEVGMEEGRLVEFLVVLGATVAVGDPLFAVEGEKAMLEIESPVAGRVVELVAVADSDLVVGAEVLVIEVSPIPRGATGA